MSVWLALLGWALAAQALHLRGRRRLVLVARAGHEVRGPLSAARLALDGLEPSARVEAIGLELQRAALALDELSGARRRDIAGPVDVAELLSEASQVWHALAASLGATLVVAPGRARVVGDRLRLAQACGNLVANAIEHGAAREFAGRHEPPLFDDDPRLVHVRSYTSRGRVRIEIRDCGPGLPAPIGELIVAARGRQSARGHGLAIAAGIAERHGGRLASLPAARGAHLVLELPEAP